MSLLLVVTEPSYLLFDPQITVLAEKFLKSMLSDVFALSRLVDEGLFFPFFDKALKESQEPCEIGRDTKCIVRRLLLFGCVFLVCDFPSEYRRQNLGSLSNTVCQNTWYQFVIQVEICTSSYECNSGPNRYQAVFGLFSAVNASKAACAISSLEIHGIFPSPLAENISSFSLMLCKKLVPKFSA